MFRNETLDATHLAEFHQVEGVVADRGLGLADLISVLDAFFKRLGFDKLQFKPAYNPYTEPSMEIFAYHTGKFFIAIDIIIIIISTNYTHTRTHTYSRVVFSGYIHTWPLDWAIV